MGDIAYKVLSGKMANMSAWLNLLRYWSNNKIKQVIVPVSLIQQEIKTQSCFRVTGHTFFVDFLIQNSYVKT